jgi:hypothetical protein
MPDGKVIHNARVTLAGNRTLRMNDVQDGYCGQLIVIQDGVGGRTLTLPAGSKVAGGGAGAIALTAAANAKDVLYWFFDGTNLYWTRDLNFT